MSFSKKYQPKSIQDMAIEDPDTKQRLEDYADGLRWDNVLLHGPKGTGKSTAARAISDARVNNGSGAFYTEFEGATFSKDDFDKILNEWQLQSFSGVNPAVCVINEIDLLSSALLEQLKAFIDKHGERGQIIATTNNLHKLSGPLKDRFDVMELPAVSSAALEQRFREIFDAEEIDISDEALGELADTINGSWRDGLRAAEDIVVEHKRSLMG